MKTGFQRLFDAAKPRVRAIVIATIVVAALLAAIFAAPVKSFLKIIPDVLTWPIALLLIIIYLGSSSNATNRLSRLFARFGSLKLLGSEVTFTTEGARQLFSDAEDAFEDFKRQADHEFRRQVRAQNLQEKMSRIFRAVSDNDDLDLINIAKKEGVLGAQCTLRTFFSEIRFISSWNTTHLDQGVKQVDASPSGSALLALRGGWSVMKGTGRQMLGRNGNSLKTGE